MLRRDFKFWHGLTPGSRLFLILFIVNIPLNVILHLADGTLLVFLVTIAKFIVFGVIGAGWENDHLAVTDENEPLVNGRRRIAAITGAICYILMFAISVFIAIVLSEVN